MQWKVILLVDDFLQTIATSCRNAYSFVQVVCVQTLLIIQAATSCVHRKTLEQLSKLILESLLKACIMHIIRTKMMFKSHLPSN